MTLAHIVSGPRSSTSGRRDTFLSDVDRYITDNGAVTPTIDLVTPVTELPP